MEMNFSENMRRGKTNDPAMHHGWKRVVINKTLHPTLLPVNTSVTPDIILQLISVTVPVNITSLARLDVHVPASCCLVQFSVGANMDWNVLMGTLK